MLMLFPRVDDIHASVLNAVRGDNALNMRYWHSCETTHCRAGWVVVLAGDAGKELESQTSTEFAAMMIYKASSSIRVAPTQFYKSNDDAMADIERCAKLESECKQ